MTTNTQKQPHPLFKRARDFYLYTQKSERYIDLCLNNGCAVWGHKPRGLGKLIKQVLDRGIVGHISNKWELQCRQAIKSCFSLEGWNWGGWYNSFHQYFTPNNEHTLPLFRPYSGTEIENKQNAMLFMIPHLWNSCFAVLLYRTTQPNSNYCAEDMLGIGRKLFVKTNNISSLDYTQIYYSLKMLNITGLSYRPLPTQTKNRNDIYSCGDNKTRPAHSANRYKKKYKNIKNIELPLLQGWQQKGIYLILPTMEQQQYTKIREVFLEGMFYTPEWSEEKNFQSHRLWIVPPYLTKQEFQSWEKVYTKIKMFTS